MAKKLSKTDKITWTILALCGAYLLFQIIMAIITNLPNN